MSTHEKGMAADGTEATVSRGAGITERGMAGGTYEIECVGPDGKVRWRDTVENVVTTLGKNVMLDAALAGAAYTVVGPFMGLISSVGYTGVPVVGDTMGSHATWTEAGATNAPTYTAPRKTAAWNAAGSGSKALSAALAFVITATPGTVKGCFLVYGTGAVSTIDNTAGTLYSAGVFSGGDKVVGTGDTLNVSYTTSL
jgi:hypothetical protein